MKLPARVTDPDGYPGVAVRVVPSRQGEGLYDVVGPDRIIRQFPIFVVTEGWPRKESPYVTFLRDVP